jgi:hypothetical protein
MVKALMWVKLYNIKNSSNRLNFNGIYHCRVKCYYYFYPVIKNNLLWQKSH